MKIIFEKIRLFHYPLLQYHLWKGNDISVFDFDYDLKQRLWLRRLIHQGLLRRIYVSCILQGDREGIEETDTLYGRLRHDRMERELARLYGGDQVDLIFKKWLVQAMSRTFYIHRYLEEEEKKNPKEAIVFISDDYAFYVALLRQWGQFPLAAFKKIEIARWFLWVRPLERGLKKFFYLLRMEGYLLAKLVLMLAGRFLNGRPSAPKLFRYGVAIHQDFDIAKGFDFLTDEKNIKREEVLFLLYVPVAKDWILSHEREGYHFLDVETATGFSGLLKSRCPYVTILKAGKSLLKAPLYLSSLLPLFQAYLRSLRVYIDYGLLFHSVAVNNYIYRNQESGNQIALNILLRGAGGKSWNYAFSIGGGYLYAENLKAFGQKQYFLWAFLNSDHYVGVSEDQVKYHQLHLQKIHHYHIVGNIYSGMVAEALQNNPRFQKVVSFFDTSFIDDESCCTTFDHALLFYQDILRLLEEEKDIFIVIKPAKDDAYFIHPRAQWSSLKKGAEIIRLWNILRKQSRVFWAGEQGNTPNIIAKSDLVITHAYSSPTAEALGVGKKAFWYQSKGRQPFLYHDIPDLVVHGYPLLKEKIGALLSMDEQRYKEHLHRHVKGRLDPFLDGLALRRFRQLLCAS